MSEPPKVGERRTARLNSVRAGAHGVRFSFACPQCRTAVPVQSAKVRTVGEVRGRRRCPGCATTWETQPYSDRPDDIGTLLDVKAIEVPLRPAWERRHAPPSH